MSLTSAAAAAAAVDELLAARREAAAACDGKKQGRERERGVFFAAFFPFFSSFSLVRPSVPLIGSRLSHSNLPLSLSAVTQCQGERADG